MCLCSTVDSSDVNRTEEDLFPLQPFFGHHLRSTERSTGESIARDRLPRPRFNPDEFLRRQIRRTMGWR